MTLRWQMSGLLFEGFERLCMERRSIILLMIDN